jgi:hypothetical protein
MGAFNEWVKGSFLEQPKNRNTVTVARNLLFGAAVLRRLNTLKDQGVILPLSGSVTMPMSDSQIIALSG